MRFFGCSFINVLNPSMIYLSLCLQKRYARRGSVIDSPKKAVESSDAAETVFELASSIVMLMLGVGVSGDKAKTFISRVKLKQALSETHFETLNMLVDNMCRYVLHGD